jgi:hypothetical protein
MPLDLQGKIGPLPAWAWGGLIGVTVVGFSYWRSSTTKVTTADNTPAVIDGVDGAFGGANGGGVNGAPGGGTTGTDPNTIPDAPSYDAGDVTTLPDYSGVDFNDTTSLDTWVARAVIWLSGQGNSPQEAQQQINDYLSGAPGANQDSLIQSVIAHFGAPPMGVDPSGVNVSGTGPTELNTPKGPDKPGYYQAWSNQTHNWVYFKNAPTATDLAKSTKPTAIPFDQRSRLTVPELPPKAGYHRGWNEKTRSWFYFRP